MQDSVSALAVHFQASTECATPCFPCSKVCTSPLWTVAHLPPPQLQPPASPLEVATTSSALHTAVAQLKHTLANSSSSSVEQQQQQLQELQEQLGAFDAAAAAVRAPFVWVDGPLVVAMRRGDMLLVDEINLAEDAVLERLNR